MLLPTSRGCWEGHLRKYPKVWELRDAMEIEVQEEESFTLNRRKALKGPAPPLEDPRAYGRTARNSWSHDRVVS